MSLNIFISHSSSSKKFAHEIKKFLSEYGCDSFVAHDDIKPSRPWEKEIESWLGKMDVLVALVSEKFHDGSWCDQELGWAMGRNVPIVTLLIGGTPHGFIGKWQGLSVLNEGELKLFDIYDSLLGLSDKSDIVRSWAIEQLGESVTYACANRIAEGLKSIDFSNEEKARIQSIYNENDQVTNSNSVNKYFDFIEQI